MTPFESFAVVRVPFPFSDRQASKRRPALVLSEPAFQQRSGHLLLAMVTSARQSAWPLDWPIDNLTAAGLKQPCLVRLKLFTLDERLVLGTLGLLAAQDRAGVTASLHALLPAGG
jgi:mRNA interferase MazF